MAGAFPSFVSFINLCFIYLFYKSTFSEWVVGWCLLADLSLSCSYLPFPTHWLEAYSSLHASMIEGKLPRRFIVYRAGYDYKGGLGDRYSCERRGLPSARFVGLIEPLCKEYLTETCVCVAELQE